RSRSNRVSRRTAHTASIRHAAIGRFGSAAMTSTISSFVVSTVKLTLQSSVGRTDFTQSSVSTSDASGGGGRGRPQPEPPPPKPDPLEPKPKLPVDSRPIVDGRVPGSNATYDVTGDTARPIIATCSCSSCDSGWYSSAPNTNAAVCRENFSVNATSL